LNCVSHASYTSGSQFTGLTAGTSYYVTITAVASSGYLAATTAPFGPTGATLAYGTAAGSVAVTYTGSSNAPGGQTYTATACTNVGMTTGCVTNANFASASNLTGLAFTQGSAGTAYFVTVTANASSGYLAAAASSLAGPPKARSQLSGP